MIERFAQLPSALKAKTRVVRLGPAGIPALLAHPDWERPAPVVLWMHGRTVDKTLDPGRYLRWIRSGIAACAVDLPGHGERPGPSMHEPEQTLYVVEQMVGEIDGIVEALDGAEFAGVFDRDRMGMGGMSAGGMAAMRRSCQSHPFKAIAVESSVGDFSVMPYQDRFPADLINRLDPIRHLDGWRAIPFLALHSEKDEWAPVEGMRRFVERLRQRYAETTCETRVPLRRGGVREAGRDACPTGRSEKKTGETPVPLGTQSSTDETPVPLGTAPQGRDSMIEFITWPQTGAPNEHAGFGKVANDAKNIQLGFFTKWLV